MKNFKNKSAYLKPKRIDTFNNVDINTGEITPGDANTTYYLADSKEEFYLMYSSMVLILKGSSDVKMKLFAALLERYSRGQEFSMSKSLKEIIAKETSCKPRSLDAAFTFLLREKIVVKLGTLLYMINPRHVFQGSSNERNAQLKAVLELHCKFC